MTKVFVDSSFDDRLQIAGIGIAVYKGESKEVISHFIKALSNNEAEIYACYIGGILANGGEVYTDSQTAIEYINQTIKDKPRTLAQYIRHKRCEYWACKARHLGIKLQKIKAHTPYFQTLYTGNRLADIASKDGRSKFYEIKNSKDISL